MRGVDNCFTKYFFLARFTGQPQYDGKGSTYMKMDFEVVTERKRERERERGFKGESDPKVNGGAQV